MSSITRQTSAEIRLRLSWFRTTVGQSRVCWLVAAAITALVLSGVLRADEAPEPVKRGKAGANAPGGVIEPKAVLDTPDLQEDFAALCIDADGSLWLAYVEYNGTADVLQLAQ